MKKLSQFFLISLFILQTNLLPQSPIVQQIINSVNVDSLIYFVKELSGDVPTIINGTPQTILSRAMNQPGNALAEAYIKQKLESYGLTVTIQNYSATGNNVLATQVGTLYPNKKFIICAHYDDMPEGTIAPGADDNASGTATVIEAARIFSQYTFPFTIVYALWDEEEHGLLGSSYYATQAADAGDSILCVINLDMISIDSNNDGVCIINNRSVGSSIILYNKMVQVNTQYGINLNIVSYNPGSPNSDHSSFWNKGYGAIMLIEDYYDYNQHYHTENDLLQYFNIPYYTKSAKLALGTLADLALNNLWTIFVQQPYVDKPYARLSIDSVLFRTRFSNMHNHQFTAHLTYVNSDTTQIDSLTLFDDGLHGDSIENDGIYGVYIPPRTIEDFYFLSTSIVDHQANEYINFTDISRFTTAGPLKLESVAYTKVSNVSYNLKPFVRNDGTSKAISGAKIRLYCNDPWIDSIGAGYYSLPNITPGATVSINFGVILVRVIDSLFTGKFNLKANIIVNNWSYWVDSTILIVTGVEEEPNEIPKEFLLSQNFPNPFNPSTNIQYAIASRQFVTLKVYDILGTEIATLVNQEKSAGNYEANFNASKLPSGVYIYKMKAGEYVETKKMVLLK